MAENDKEWLNSRRQAMGLDDDDEEEYEENDFNTENRQEDNNKDVEKNINLNQSVAEEQKKIQGEPEKSESKDILQQMVDVVAAGDDEDYDEKKFIKEYNEAYDKDKFINEFKKTYQDLDYYSDDDLDKVEELLNFYETEGKEEFEKKYLKSLENTSNEKIEEIKETEKIDNEEFKRRQKELKENLFGKSKDEIQKPKKIDQSRIDELQNALSSKKSNDTSKTQSFEGERKFGMAPKGFRKTNPAPPIPEQIDDKESSLKKDNSVSTLYDSQSNSESPKTLSRTTSSDTMIGEKQNELTEEFQENTESNNVEDYSLSEDEKKIAEDKVANDVSFAIEELDKVANDLSSEIEELGKVANNLSSEIAEVEGNVEVDQYHDNQNKLFEEAKNLSSEVAKINQNKAKKINKLDLNKEIADREKELEEIRNLHKVTERSNPVVEDLTSKGPEYQAGCDDTIINVYGKRDSNEEKSANDLDDKKFNTMESMGDNINRNKNRRNYNHLQNKCNREKNKVDRQREGLKIAKAFNDELGYELEERGIKNINVIYSKEKFTVQLVGKSKKVETYELSKEDAEKILAGDTGFITKLQSQSRNKMKMKNVAKANHDNYDDVQENLGRYSSGLGNMIDKLEGVEKERKKYYQIFKSSKITKNGQNIKKLSKEEQKDIEKVVNKATRIDKWWVRGNKQSIIEKYGDAEIKEDTKIPQEYMEVEKNKEIDKKVEIGKEQGMDKGLEENKDNSDSVLNSLIGKLGNPLDSVSAIGIYNKNENSGIQRSIPDTQLNRQHIDKTTDKLERSLNTNGLNKVNVLIKGKNMEEGKEKTPQNKEINVNVLQKNKDSMSM